MAILLSSQQTGSLDDTNEQVYIGLKMPLDNSGSPTNLEAAKEDIKHLLSTKMGERVMQPLLGNNIYNMLFEPITETTADEIKSEIGSLVNRWLPFVNINKVEVDLGRDDSDTRNTISINLEFGLGNIPGLESVQVNI